MISVNKNTSFFNKTNEAMAIDKNKSTMAELNLQLQL